MLLVLLVLLLVVSVGMLLVLLRVKKKGNEARYTASKSRNGHKNR